MKNISFLYLVFLSMPLLTYSADTKVSSYKFPIKIARRLPYPPDTHIQFTTLLHIKGFPPRGFSLEQPTLTISTISDSITASISTPANDSNKSVEVSFKAPFFKAKL